MREIKILFLLNWRLIRPLSQSQIPWYNGVTSGGEAIFKYWSRLAENYFIIATRSGDRITADLFPPIRFVITYVRGINLLVRHESDTSQSDARLT